MNLPDIHFKSLSTVTEVMVNLFVKTWQGTRVVNAVR